MRPRSLPRPDTGIGMTPFVPAIAKSNSLLPRVLEFVAKEIKSDTLLVHVHDLLKVTFPLVSKRKSALLSNLQRQLAKTGLSQGSRLASVSVTTILQK
jgi:hypothetical protein